MWAGYGPTHRPHFFGDGLLDAAVVVSCVIGALIVVVERGAWCLGVFFNLMNLRYDVNVCKAHVLVGGYAVASEAQDNGCLVSLLCSR